MKIPISIGIIHLIGIGGIGMSGIAEILYNLGYKVQGSDQMINSNIIRLKNKGIKIFLGHDTKNIEKVNVVVISSAIPKDNIEYLLACKLNLPILKRSEMLSELMRFRRSIAICGTHGKTTTTSLIGSFLEEGGFDPMIVNGGIINSYDTNIRMGKGEWIIVEADESDGTFIELPIDIAVITNIDSDHINYYKNFQNIFSAFHKLVNKIPFYGFCVMCFDHPKVRKLINNFHNLKIITYGSHHNADVRFFNVQMNERESCFNILINDRKNDKKIEIKEITFSMPGLHNISNATASIAVAYELGISTEIFKKKLSSFQGINRRFTYVGSWKNVKIFDDYGHHPVEIKAVLETAQKISNGKIIAIMQPHRFSRLKFLFLEFSACFKNADIVIILPVYPSGENPIKGINSENLVQSIRKFGNENVFFLDNLDKIAPLIKKIAKCGDYVIFFGAGDITKWAHKLPNQLKN